MILVSQKTLGGMPAPHFTSGDGTCLPRLQHRGTRPDYVGMTGSNQVLYQKTLGGMDGT